MEKYTIVKVEYTRLGVGNFYFSINNQIINILGFEFQKAKSSMLCRHLHKR